MQNAMKMITLLQYIFHNKLASRDYTFFMEYSKYPCLKIQILQCLI